MYYERGQSTACVQNRASSELTPACKARRHDHGRKLSKSPKDNTRFHERESVGKRHGSGIRRPAPKVSGSDMYLEEMRKRKKKGVSTTQALDSTVKVGNRGYHAAFEYESGVPGLHRLTDASDEIFHLQQQSMYENQISENIYLQPEMWTKVREQSVLPSKYGTVSKTRKDFEHFCGERQDVGQFLQRKPGISPRKQLIFEEHSYRGVDQDAKEMLANARLKSKRPFDDETTTFFGLNSTIIENICDGAQSKRTAVQEHESEFLHLGNSEFRHDTSTTYKDVSQKDRRARASKKRQRRGRVNVREDMLLLHSKETDERSKKQEKTPFDSVSGRNKPLSSELVETRYKPKHGLGETPKKNKNYSYSHCLIQPSDLARNQRYLIDEERHLWDQSTTYDSLTGNDRADDGYYQNEQFYPNDTLPFSGPFSCPSSPRSSSQKKGHRPLAKQDRRYDNVINESEYTELEGKRKTKPYGNSRHRKAVDNGDNNIDEVQTMERRKNLNDIAKLNYPASDSEKDAFNSLWTCAMWTDNNLSEICEEDDPQWAYEVYSDVHMKPLSGHTTSDTGPGLDISRREMEDWKLQHQCKLNNVHHSKRFCVRNCPILQGESPLIGQNFTPKHSSHQTARNMLNYRRRSKRTWKHGKERDGGRRICDIPMIDDSELMAELYSKDAASQVMKLCISQTKLPECAETKQKHWIETNLQTESTSQEKDSSSHNTEHSYMRKDVHHDLDHPAKARVTSQIPNAAQAKEKMRQVPEIMDNLNNDDSNKSDASSTWQTANSVDGKLMKTVHSIKEDIQSVLERLNSLELNDDRESAQAAQTLKQNVESLLNSPVLNKTRSSLSDVNCACDIVKNVFIKLISLKNNHEKYNTEDEHDSSSLSYDDYKKGKEEYLTSVQNDDVTYDIEVITTPEIRPLEASQCKSGKQPQAGEQANSDTLTGADNPSSARPSSRSSRSDIPSLESGDLVLTRDACSQEEKDPRVQFVNVAQPERNKSSSSLSSIAKNTRNKRDDSRKNKIAMPEVASDKQRSKLVSPFTFKKNATKVCTRRDRSNSPNKNKGKSPILDNSRKKNTNTPATAAKSSLSKAVSNNRKRKTSSNSGKTTHEKSDNKSLKMGTVSVAAPKRPVRTNDSTRVKSLTGSTESLHETRNKQAKSQKTPDANSQKPTRVSRTPTPTKRMAQKLQNDKADDKGEEKKPQDRCCMQIVVRAYSQKDQKRSSPLSKAIANALSASLTPKENSVFKPTDIMTKAKKSKSNIESSKYQIHKIPSNSKNVSKDSAKELSEAEVYINWYGAVGTDAEEKSRHSSKKKITPPNSLHVQDPDVSYQIPNQKGKWSSFKKGRSKSKTRKRRKNITFTDTYANNASRISSSDTSILPQRQIRRRGKTNSFKRYVDSHKSFLSRDNYAEPGTVNISKRKSSKSNASRVNADLTTSARTEAIPGIGKSRHNSSSSFSTESDFFFDSVKACDKAACTLDDNREHAISKRASKNDLVKWKQDPLPSVSRSELNVSIQKLYKEISKLRVQLETSTDDLKVRPLSLVCHQEKCSLMSTGEGKTPETEENIPTESPAISTYSSKKNMCAAAMGPGLKALELFKESPSMSCYHLKKMNGSYGDSFNAGTNLKRYSAKINFQETVISPHLVGMSRSDILNSVQDEYRDGSRAHGKCVSEQRTEQYPFPEAKLLSNTSLSPFLELQNVASVRQSNLCRENNPLLPYTCCSNVMVEELKPDTYWPNDDVYITATCSTSDSSDTQIDATEKFETAASDSGDMSSRLNLFNPVECKEILPNTRHTYQYAAGNKTRDQQKLHISPCSRVKSKPAGRASTPVSGMKMKEFMMTDTTYDEIKFERMKQESLNNNMRQSDDLWPDRLPNEQQIPPRQLTSSKNAEEKRKNFPPAKGSNVCDQVSKNCGHTQNTNCENIRTLFCNFCQHKDTEVEGGSEIQKHNSTDKNVAQWHLEQKPTTENVALCLHETARRSTEEPVRNTAEDSLSLNSAPFVVKCVRGVIFGPSTALAASSPKLCDFPSAMRSSKEFPNSWRSKNSTTAVPVAKNEVDEICLDGYVRCRKEERTTHKPKQSKAKVLDTPFIETYIYKKRESYAASVSSSRQSVKHTKKCLGDGDRAQKTPASDKAQWMTKGLVPPFLKEKDVLLTSHTALGRTPHARFPQTYAATYSDMKETDRAMKHYSDAISNKSRKRFLGNDLYQLSASPAIKTHECNSDIGKSDLSENERECSKIYDGVKRYIASSVRPSHDQKSESSPSRGCFNKNHNTSGSENSLVASFESMMQQRRPCYVEHCGFRQKKRDISVTDRCDESVHQHFSRPTAKYKLDNKMSHIPVPTVANDNNSSTDIKLTRANTSHYMFEDTDKSFGILHSDIDSKLSLVNRSVDRLNLQVKDEEDTCDDYSGLSSRELTSELRNENTEYDKTSDGDDGNHENGENKTEINLAKEEMSCCPENSLTDEVAKGGDEAKDVEERERVEGGETLGDARNCRNQQTNSKNCSSDADERESWYKTTDEESDVRLANNDCVFDNKERQGDDSDDKDNKNADGAGGDQEEEGGEEEEEESDDGDVGGDFDIVYIHMREKSSEATMNSQIWSNEI